MDDAEAGIRVADGPVEGDDMHRMRSAADRGTPARRLSPKRPQMETVGMADLFPYYAGFSFEWAVSHLKEHIPDATAIILDPWNGSGTTTLAAQSIGVNSIGVDLNPIANVVARLRSSSLTDISPSSPPELDCQRVQSSSGHDPLSEGHGRIAAERAHLHLSGNRASGP